MSLARVFLGAVMITFAGSAVPSGPHLGTADAVLTMLGASSLAQARMCDPGCRYRCC